MRKTSDVHPDPHVHALLFKFRLEIAILERSAGLIRDIAENESAKFQGAQSNCEKILPRQFMEPLVVPCEDSPLTGYRKRYRARERCAIVVENPVNLFGLLPARKPGPLNQSRVIGDSGPIGVHSKVAAVQQNRDLFAILRSPQCYLGAVIRINLAYEPSG